MALFMSVGLNMYLFHRKVKRKLLLRNGVASCLLMVLTVLIPFPAATLHGYA